MFKYILVFLSIFLSSCFWWKSVDNSWALKEFDSWEYSISLPSVWSIIWDKSEILPRPAIWKISLAITSTKFIDWFSNNLIILSDEISSKIDSSEYSYLNYLWSKWKYYDYKLLNESEFSFFDWNKSKLYIFEARYNTSTPRLNFLQTWIVCKNKSYLLTIALNHSITDFSKYKEIIKSFSCK